MQPMWRIAFEVPEAHVTRFAEVVEPHVDAVSTFEIEEGGRWLVEGTSYNEPDTGRLSTKIALLATSLGLPQPDFTAEPLPPIDWVTQTYLSFPPIQAGRFFIHGSHHKKPVPLGSIGLQIEAAMAFGSGEHATTQGCLRAISNLRKSRTITNALDMGCGSGILALAAAKTWRVPVVAVDIDPEAVRVTQENARLNRVAHLVRAQGGDGYRTPVVRRFAPYRLITANILARPLARMAPRLARHLAPGGYAVLAGLLARQENHVLQAHRAQGLRLAGRIPMGEWTTLILRRG